MRGLPVQKRNGGSRPALAPELLQRGGGILQSEIFSRAMQERHHWTSVGEHSLGVAQEALRIADLLARFGLRADRDVLVLCALCHDLGIIDRLKKYGDSAARCCRGHPKDSLRLYEQYVHPASPTERDCVLHHMWPVLPAPPHTLEGMIINLADKRASFREVLARSARAARPSDAK